jgi:hypothetical protein
MKQKSIDRLYDGLVDGIAELFALRLRSDVFQEIQKISADAGISLDEILKKFWSKQYEAVVHEAYSYASRQRSARKWENVFTSNLDPIMRLGFQEGVRKVFGREVAYSAWNYITKPMEAGELQNKSLAEWRVGELFGATKKVEALGFENILMVIEPDSRSALGAMEWDVAKKYSLHDESDLPVKINFGRDGDLFVGLEWTDYLHAKGMSREY